MIRSVDTFPLRIPYDVGGPKQEFLGRPRVHLEALFVRVVTDDGVVGWGECFGINVWRPVRVVLDDYVGPFVVGRDEDARASLMLELKRRLHVYGRSGPVMYGLSGLDIALWDIAAKKAGVPLHVLLRGDAPGDAPTSLPAYASLMRYVAEEPLRSNCERALALGYDAVKIHETTLAQCVAARDALGGARLMVDTNCAWTLGEAHSLLPSLERLDLAWLEEPTWPPEDFDQHRALHAATGIPLSAGENAATTFELLQLARSGALAVVQPSVTKQGGVTDLVDFLAAVAHAAPSVRVVPHSPYFGPGLLATLHVAAASSHEMPVERLFCDFDAHPLGAAIDAVDGRLVVPTGPGLGVDPDPALMAAYAA